MLAVEVSMANLGKALRRPDLVQRADAQQPFTVITICMIVLESWEQMPEAARPDISHLQPAALTCLRCGAPRGSRRVVKQPQPQCRALPPSVMLWCGNGFNPQASLVQLWAKNARCSALL